MPHTKIIKSTSAQNNIIEYIKECKRLQQESILIAEKIREDNLEEGLNDISYIMRATPTVIKNIYSLQNQYNTSLHIDATFFNLLGQVAEEIQESIIVEDWVSLSDMLEFEYTSLLERLVVSLEDTQKELV